MTTATMRLIEAVERLNMTGEIGDGMVAHLHDLAAGARLEVTPPPIPVILGRLSPEALASLKSRAARCPHPPEATHRAPGTAGLGLRCGKCGFVAVPR